MNNIGNLAYTITTNMVSGSTLTKTYSYDSDIID